MVYVGLNPGLKVCSCHFNVLQMLTCSPDEKQRDDFQQSTVPLVVSDMNKVLMTVADSKAYRQAAGKKGRMKGGAQPSSAHLPDPTYCARPQPQPSLHHPPPSHPYPQPQPHPRQRPRSAHWDVYSHSHHQTVQPSELYHEMNRAPSDPAHRGRKPHSLTNTYYGASYDIYNRTPYTGGEHQHSQEFQALPLQTQNYHVPHRDYGGSEYYRNTQPWQHSYRDTLNVQQRQRHRSTKLGNQRPSKKRKISDDEKQPTHIPSYQPYWAHQAQQSGYQDNYDEFEMDSSNVPQDYN